MWVILVVWLHGLLVLVLRLKRLLLLTRVTKSGAGHDNLEDIYAGVDSLVDTTDKGHAGSNVVEEDDPLAEFEAWVASGAVIIVDKL
jgi:hypothetical protein